MLSFIKEPYSSKELDKILNPLVREWFFKNFKEFSLPQLYGVMEIHKGNNILITAPTGGTKCVTPDTSILLDINNQTKILKGYDLIRLAKNEGKLIKKTDKSGSLYKIDNLKSYSLADNIISKKDAYLYFEKTDDYLYKIKTEYGRIVKLSGDHPLLVETEQGLQWVHTKDIKRGQKIAVANFIELPEKDIFFNTQGAIRLLRKKYKIVLDINSYISLKKSTNGFTEFDNLEIKSFIELITLCGLTFEGITRNIAFKGSLINILKNKNHKKRQLFFNYLRKKLNKIIFEDNRVIYKSNWGGIFSFRYPKKADRKLVRWLAFVLAEGFIGDYKKGTHLMVSQKNKLNLLNEFFSISKEIFDLKFKRKNEKDFTGGNTGFCYFLSELLSLDIGRSRYVKIPSWVLNLKKELKKEFLNVFISLESVIAKKREIKLSQSNQNKIESIYYMLLSFGIFSSLSKRISVATNTKKKVRRVYNYLTIGTIENLKKFLNYIGIDDKNSYLLEEHILKKKSGDHVNKHKYNYKKISYLSNYFQDYGSFLKEFKNIHEVVRKTGYITNVALIQLKNKLNKLQKDNEIDRLLEEIDCLLNRNFTFLKITKKIKYRYKGYVVDLTVPNEHNFIGGFGGIILHNTLTSTLSIINELVTLAENNVLENKIYCLYLNPLKSLSNDLEVNLQKPLKEIKEIASKQGKNIDIRIGVRTGDTTAAEKASMLRKPPHILILTPESLAILLSTIKFREFLRDVKYVIIDEIHALAENKRGVHLSLSLERLSNFVNNEYVRIGLSATIAPLDEIANFLVGDRNCLIADVRFDKKYDLKLLSPVEDLINVDYNDMHSSMYTLIDNLIQSHKTTLIFTNTRSATERVVHYLKEKFPRKYMENIGAHHGSLSKALRHNIENRMREGQLKVCVSSTSLELGLDIGFIDLVVCLGSPKSIARLSQRFGRAGHKLHDTVRGRIIVLDRDDLIESAVMLKCAIERKIDRIHIPRNCLDVLAQQIIGIAVSDKIRIDNLYKMIKRSYCYKDLEKKDFLEVLDYLAGEYTTLEDRNVYAKIWKDSEFIGRRGKLTRMLYMTNIGTIPEESHIIVKLGEQVIGTIEEGFLERLKPGDVFVLGGETYTFRYSKGQTAQVSVSVDRPPTVPSWFSEMLPLSFDLSLEINKFRKYMEERFKKNESKEQILKFINEYLYVDKNGSQAIYNYFNEQYLLLKEIPNEKKLVIEYYKEDSGLKIVFHSLYGRRVNDCLSRALAYCVYRSQRKEVEIGINDNGFYLSGKDIQAKRALELLMESDLKQILEKAIDNSEVLKRRFRHCAVRALMILRSYKGRTKRVGRQQVSSMLLINAVKRISEDFSILKEAKREVLEDLMDLENCKKILQDIKNKKIEVKEVHTKIPSPFAFNLVLQGYTDILKMEDKVRFLRNMHNMVLARINVK
ncbi:MAG: ATP-dependent helicase [archaeon]